MWTKVCGQTSERSGSVRPVLDSSWLDECQTITNTKVCCLFSLVPFLNYWIRSFKSIQTKPEHESFASPVEPQPLVKVSEDALKLWTRHLKTSLQKFKFFNFSSFFTQTETNDYLIILSVHKVSGNSETDDRITDSVTKRQTDHF